ncbi:MAG TPA: PAS domain S-box protein, partial [Coleofasciculaceae cyanobacterium]
MSRQAISLTTGFPDYSLCCASDQIPLEWHRRLVSWEILEKNHKPANISQQRSGQNQATLQRVLEQAYLVAVTDSKGKIKYVNEKFCKFYQYSASELEGINHRLLNSRYHSSEFFRQMWATISRGQIWRGEIRNRAKDGSLYWVDTTIVPILNEQGKPTEYVSLCKDISDRKPIGTEDVSTGNQEKSATNKCPAEARLREQTRTIPILDESNRDCYPPQYGLGDRTSACPDAYRFFTLSPDLLCVISLDGYFRHVNPAFEKTLFYSPEELLNRHILDFVHPDDTAATRVELEKLASNSSILYFENRYRCQDGSYKWLAWKFSKPVEDGLVYAIARDTTKRKQTEASLLERSRLSSLEAEIGVVLVQSGSIESRLQPCVEAMVQHLDAIGAGIWTVDPARVEMPNSSPLNLKASAGQLLPADIFTKHIPAHQGLLGAIAQTRQPIDAQFSSIPQQEKTASIGHHQERQPYKIFFTGYPLVVESRLVGVIGLFSHHSLSGEVYGALGWIANAIAVAIDRAWAWDEVLKRREALLFWLASQIRHSLDIDTILATAVNEVRSLMQVDCCHFLWCSLEPNQASLSVTHEARDPDLPNLLVEESLPQLAPLEQAIRNLQTLRIDDVVRDRNLDSKTRSLFTNWGITSGLLLPLKTQTGQLGAIFCSHYHNPRAWNQDDVELLQAVVNQIAI